MSQARMAWVIVLVSVVGVGCGDDAGPEDAAAGAAGSAGGGSAGNARGGSGSAGNTGSDPDGGPEDSGSAGVVVSDDPKGGAGDGVAGTDAAGASAPDADAPDASKACDAGECRVCDAPEGRYEALYTPLSGNCGAVASPHPVSFASPANGVVTVVEMRGVLEVETSIAVEGCGVSLMQLARRLDTGADRIEWRVTGLTLEIVSATEITGEVTYERPGLGDLEGCSGTYDAVLRKAPDFLGAGQP